MITVIGYGSLMSEESANRTCKVFDFRYGYIKNYRRIFNKRWFNPWTETYLDTAMLNVEFSTWKWLPVSYFSLREEDYKKMKLREKDYNEVIVPIYDLGKKEYSKGVLFISKKNIVQGTKKIDLISTGLDLEKRYLDICLGALKNTSLYEEFLYTTYLSCWEKRLQEVI